MRESLYFNFDNISSREMGVVAISDGGGLFEEDFAASRNLIETKIPNNPKPYLQRVELDPLSFPFSFYIEDKNRNNINQLANWLFKPYYCPMTFETHPNRIIYAILEGDSRLIHNGEDGYINVNVRTNSPYVYGFPTYTEPTVVNGSTTDFILNGGDFPIKPKAWITKSGDGDVTIINHKSGQRVTVTGLRDGEEVFIDFEREEIVSSLQELQIYRYNNHNDVWLQFEIDENDLYYEGNFEIRYEYQLKYINFWGE